MTVERFITLDPGRKWLAVTNTLAYYLTELSMDKLKLTGRNLGRVFKSRLSRLCAGHGL
jgi:hypothetical protein